MPPATTGSGCGQVQSRADRTEGEGETTSDRYRGFRLTRGSEGPQRELRPWPQAGILATTSRGRHAAQSSVRHPAWRDAPAMAVRSSGTTSSIDDLGQGAAGLVSPGRGGPHKGAPSDTGDGQPEDSMKARGLPETAWDRSWEGLGIASAVHRRQRDEGEEKAPVHSRRMGGASPRGRTRGVCYCVDNRGRRDRGSKATPPPGPQGLPAAMGGKGPLNRSGYG